MALWLLTNDKNDWHFRHSEDIYRMVTYLKRNRVEVRTVNFGEDISCVFKDEKSVLFMTQDIDESYIWIIRQCNERGVPVISLESPGINNGYYCNYISSDINQSISNVIGYLNTYRKKRIAFFGAQAVFVDALKLSALYAIHPEFQDEDNFCVTSTFEESLAEFYKKRDNYDAVICTNDIVSVYLIDKLSRIDFEYVEKTMFISFMNSALAKVYYRTITSCSYDRSHLPAEVLILYRTILKSREWCESHSVILKSQIFVRESTLGLPVSKKTVEIQKNNFKQNFINHSEKLVVDYKNPEIQNLFDIEYLLRYSDKLDLEIIRLFLMRKNNEEVARRLFVSVQTVKNRSSVLFKKISVKNKKDFVDLLSRYISSDNLKNYIESKKEKT